MNQQHLESYVNLIQQLLACPSGEEWILLRQNEGLVTPELVQVMEQVATQLASQDKMKEAKFLHNLAAQIHHLFVAQPMPSEGEDNRFQAYLALIKALLECPHGAEEELLGANQELISPGLVHLMQQVAAQLAANGDQRTAHYLQHWATEISRLWLQKHDFQPVLNKEPATKTLKGPRSSELFSQAVSTPPQAAVVPQPSPTLSLEEEDVWADPPPPPVAPAFQPAEAPATLVPILDPVPRSIVSVTPELISRQLETIAQALTKISEVLTPAAHTPDPLWYMDVLERAQAGNWILTSTEVQTLIGVQPSCSKGEESFQRGCWVFVKAGKVGPQVGWRVTKAELGDNGA